MPFREIRGSHAKGTITTHPRAFNFTSGTFSLHFNVDSFQFTPSQFPEHACSSLDLRLSATFNVKRRQDHLTSPFPETSLPTMWILSDMDDLVLHRHCKSNDIGS